MTSFFCRKYINLSPNIKKRDRVNQNILRNISKFLSVVSGDWIAAITPESFGFRNNIDQ